MTNLVEQLQKMQKTLTRYFIFLSMDDKLTGETFRFAASVHPNYRAKQATTSVREVFPCLLYACSIPLQVFVGTGDLVKGQPTEWSNVYRGLFPYLILIMKLCNDFNTFKIFIAKDLLKRLVLQIVEKGFILKLHLVCLIQNFFAKTEMQVFPFGWWQLSALRQELLATSFK